MEQDELEELKNELQLLNIKIKEGQQAAADKTFQEALKDIEKEAKFRIKQRRILKGHISKVTTAHFCGDSKKAVSGSLDGKLIIWDVFTGNKMRVIPLRSSWVMACAYDEQGNYVAVGGMDNMCTIYDLRGTSAKVRRELTGMDGYLSSVRFLGDSQVITGSGDTCVVLWDLERGQKVVTFEAHEGDVISLSLNPDKTTFVTGSVDNTARVTHTATSKLLLSRYELHRKVIQLPAALGHPREGMPSDVPRARGRREFGLFPHGRQRVRDGFRRQVVPAVRRAQRPAAQPLPEPARVVRLHELRTVAVRKAALRRRRRPRRPRLGHAVHA
nr:guanine nucleotide-binding protein subunit beta-2-like isoform X2 [Dermacentor andersoni]